MSTLGARMTAARERHGWTQEDVALRARLSRQAVGRLERGERRHVRSDVLERLAIALAVSADYLLGLQGSTQALCTETTPATSAKPRRGRPRPAPSGVS